MKTPAVTQSHRRGFGLLEVILVFALLMAASAILFYVAQRSNLSAHADEDRQVVSALAQNVGLLYKAGSWSIYAGPDFQYTQTPAQLGGSTCAGSADDPYGAGCVSRLTGAPILVGIIGGGGYSPFPDDKGAAYSVQIQGASQEDCNAFLAGGPADFGAIAVYGGYNAYSGPAGMHALKNGAGVSDFCAGAVSDAGNADETISSLSLVYGNPAFFPEIQ